MASNVVILGYWDIRGLVEPAKLILEYGKINYEDRRIQMSKDSWLEYKQSLGFDFPNLPFYQDSDVKITQSKAIIKHLGRKLDLAGGSSLRGQAEVDMLLDVVADYIAMATGLCYSPDFSEKLMAEWLAGVGIYSRQGPLSARLTALQNKIGEKDWFVENKLSVADFSIWELLDEHRLLFPGCLDEFGILKNFMARFQALEGVKQYLTSPRYRPFPIWSVRAKYGYEKN